MQDHNLICMTKICRKRKNPKELTEFGNRANQVDGKHYYCKICKREMDKISRDKNKLSKAASDKRWKQNNADHVRMYHAEYRRNQRRSDPMARLKHNLRRRINKALKGICASNGTMKMVGCDIKFLTMFLESQFQRGMTWENYGKWHLDHKIPLASAKTGNDLMSLFHYSNLQPLWALDNLKKSTKIPMNTEI